MSMRLWPSAIQVAVTVAFSTKSNEMAIASQHGFRGSTGKVAWCFSTTYIGAIHMPQSHKPKNRPCISLELLKGGNCEELSAETLFGSIESLMFS
jgi:hypothetical protein